MIRRLVIFLVRKKLGLKKFERFQFTNQKTDAEYYFSNHMVMKSVSINGVECLEPSSVSLNWLLDDDCEISKIA